MEIQILIGMGGFPVYGDLHRAIFVYVKAGVNELLDRNWQVTQLYQIDALWMYHNYPPYSKCVSQVLILRSRMNSISRNKGPKNLTSEEEKNGRIPFLGEIGEPIMAPKGCVCIPPHKGLQFDPQ